MVLQKLPNINLFIHILLTAACLRLFYLLNIVYLLIYTKLGLVVGMTKQISDVKEIVIVIVNPRRSR